MVRSAISIAPLTSSVISVWSIRYCNLASSSRSSSGSFLSGNFVLKSSLSLKPLISRYGFFLNCLIWYSSSSHVLRHSLFFLTNSFSESNPDCSNNSEASLSREYICFDCCNNWFRLPINLPLSSVDLYESDCSFAFSLKDLNSFSKSL